MTRHYKQIFQIPIGKLAPIAPRLSQNHNCSRRNIILSFIWKMFFPFLFLSTSSFLNFFLFSSSRTFLQFFSLFTLFKNAFLFFLSFLSLLVLFFFFLLSFFFIVAIKFKIVQLTIPTQRQSIEKCQSPPEASRCGPLRKAKKPVKTKISKFC